MTEATKFDINQVINTVKAVITTPVNYFQTMPKTGGLTEPLIFALVMGAVAGLISAILSFMSAPVGMMAYGIGAIIFVPIAALIGAFIGAAILFVIWKLMGSEENYETAFRCMAAIMAIYPITALVALIPYVGAIVSVAWSTYLVIEASVGVHGRERKTAQLVFGIIGALMLLMNLSGERAARNMASHMEEMGAQFEDFQNLPPEEAGKKMGEFLKGMEQGMGEKE